MKHVRIILELEGTRRERRALEHVPVSSLARSLGLADVDVRLLRRLRRLRLRRLRPRLLRELLEPPPPELGGRRALLRRFRLRRLAPRVRRRLGAAAGRRRVGGGGSGGSDLLHEIALVLAIVSAAEGHGAAILDPADDPIEVGVEQRVRAREQRRERPRAPKAPAARARAAGEACNRGWVSGRRRRRRCGGGCAHHARLPAKASIAVRPSIVVKYFRFSSIHDVMIGQPSSNPATIAPNAVM